MKKNKKQKKPSFFKSLIDENPVFVLCLGLCPTLAVTNTFEGSYIMGLSVLFVLLFSNFIVSLIAKFVDDHIRIPVYIIIIATFVTVLELLIEFYVPPLSKLLGVYIPLIVVNCIVLGRALSYASKNNIKNSLLDAIKVGLGFTLALSLLGFIRELLGNNTITIMDRVSNLTGYVMKYQIFPTNNIIPNRLFISPAGAFITLGLLLGLITYFRNRGDQK